MGDINQLLLVKRCLELVQPPILEIGSKDYGNTQDFRSLIRSDDYIGVDIEEGKGVDICLDFTSDFHIIDQKLSGKRFKTVICMSVLEHCKEPFKMARNITEVLDEKAVIFVSVPFVWRIHGYPFDYWRFTPHGIRTLFPDIDFDESISILSTEIVGSSAPLDCFPRFDTASDKMRRYGWLKATIIRFLRKANLLPRELSHVYLYPPIMINMFG